MILGIGFSTNNMNDQTTNILIIITKIENWKNQGEVVIINDDLIISIQLLNLIKLENGNLKLVHEKTHNLKQEMIETYYSELSEEIKKKINAGNQKSK